MSGEPKPVKLRLCLLPEDVPAYPLAVYGKEAARILKISVNEFRRLVKAGEIPAKVRGDRLVFLVQDLVHWLERLPDYKAGSEMRPKCLQNKKRG